MVVNKSEEPFSYFFFICVNLKSPGTRPGRDIRRDEKFTVIFPQNSLRLPMWSPNTFCFHLYELDEWNLLTSIDILFDTFKGKLKGEKDTMEPRVCFFKCRKKT